MEGYLIVEVYVIFQIIRTNKETHTLRQLRRKLTKKIDADTNMTKRRQHVEREVVSAENYKTISIVDLQHNAPRPITLNHCLEQSTVTSKNAQGKCFCDNHDFHKRRSIVEPEVYGRRFLGNIIIRRTSV